LAALVDAFPPFVASFSMALLFPRWSFFWAVSITTVLCGLDGLLFLCVIRILACSVPCVFYRVERAFSWVEPPIVVRPYFCSSSLYFVPPHMFGLLQMRNVPPVNVLWPPGLTHSVLTVHDPFLNSENVLFTLPI